MGCSTLTVDAEQELLKREAEFSTFRHMSVLIVSWNVDSNKPEALSGTVENLNFLTNVLQSMDRPDFIVFGFQELINLESRKMAAKTVLLGQEQGRGRVDQPEVVDELPHGAPPCTCM